MSTVENKTVIALVLLSLICISSAFSFSRVGAGDSSVSIYDAIYEGTVTATIVSTGSASGRVAELTIIMKLDIQITVNIVDSGLEGMVLVNPNGDEQDLIISAVLGVKVTLTTYRPVSELELNPGESVTFLVSGYCINLDKGNPTNGTVFTLSKTSDKTDINQISGLLGILETTKFPEDYTESQKINIKQVALWAAQSENEEISRADYEERGYSINDEGIPIIEDILARAATVIDHKYSRMSVDYETGEEVPTPNYSFITSASSTMVEGGFEILVEFGLVEDLISEWSSVDDVSSFQITLVFNDPALPSPPMDPTMYMADKVGNRQIAVEWQPGLNYIPVEEWKYDDTIWQMFPETDASFSPNLNKGSFFITSESRSIDRSWLSNVDNYGVILEEHNLQTNSHTLGINHETGRFELPLRPRAPTTISFSADHTSIMLGDSTMFSGSILPRARILPPISGAEVMINVQNEHISWEETVPTDTLGKFQYSWTPEKDGTFKATASYLGAESDPITITVDKCESEISIDVPKDQIDKSGNIEITGKISPPKGGVSVELTYTQPDGSTITRQVTTEQDGTFKDVFGGELTEKTGTYDVIATWDGDEECFGSTSQMISFIVQAPVPGFQYESIVLGLVFGAFILWLLQRRM